MARVTMKDIAARMDVSVNTVHKALTGKPGVSDEVRARIASLADEMGYRRNANASSLRRKDAKIVVCLPSPAKSGRYYYAYLWEGCRSYIEDAPDVGAVFENIEYAFGLYAIALAGILDRINEGEHIDGLLTLAPIRPEGTALLKEIAETGTAVVLLDGDKPQTKRIAAVVSDYAMAGSLMAEQAINLLRGKQDARILLLAGDPQSESHALVARAFHEYLRAQRAQVRVDDLCGAHQQEDRLHEELSRVLNTARPDMVCSVFAVGSEVLADTLVELGMVGEILAIGNDLFPESVLALRRGIVNNLVYKDPFGMARGCLILCCWASARKATWSAVWWSWCLGAISTATQLRRTFRLRGREASKIRFVAHGLSMSGASLFSGALSITAHHERR